MADTNIRTQISRLSGAKSDLATAITAKGVTVPDTTTLDGYAALVEQLPEGLHYQPLPEFPEVSRDLALVADEDTACGTITAEMQRACKQLARVELFDIYRSDAIGAGKKSMAFTLHFAPENKALEPADVDRFVKKILGNLKFKLGIEIR